MEIHSAFSHWPSPSMRPQDAQGLSLPGAAQASASDAREETRESGEVTPAGAIQSGEPEASAKSEETQRQSGRPDEAQESLSEEELRLVERLKERDAEVRAHEMAHVAAGGRYVTSGPSYDYQIGPDGKGYAIGGEVGIDTSMDSGDPAANLEKARAILRAAMAPAEPSAQDYQVAAAARSMEAQAAQALQEQRQVGATERRQSEGGDEVARRDEQTDPAISKEVRGGVEAGEARSRLERRIAEFFAVATDPGFSQFA